MFYKKKLQVVSGILCKNPSLTKVSNRFKGQNTMARPRGNASPFETEDTFEQKMPKPRGSSIPVYDDDSCGGVENLDKILNSNKEELMDPSDFMTIVSKFYRLFW